MEVRPGDGKGDESGAGKGGQKGMGEGGSGGISMSWLTCRARGQAENPHSGAALSRSPLPPPPHVHGNVHTRIHSHSFTYRIICSPTVHVYSGDLLRYLSTPTHIKNPCTQIHACIPVSVRIHIYVSLLMHTYMYVYKGAHILCGDLVSREIWKYTDRSGNYCSAWIIIIIISSSCNFPTLCIQTTQQKLICTHKQTQSMYSSPLPPPPTHTHRQRELNKNILFK